MTARTILHYDATTGRRESCTIIKVTHHKDAGYEYSRVHFRFPDGGSSFYFTPGHVSATTEEQR
jgi:hypothetical protein